MRRIPEDIRRAIFERWLSGDTYRRIALDFNVSLSTINQIKEEEKQRNPELEELRRLSILLKKTEVNFYDTLRAANLIDKLNSCGASLKELEFFIKLAETVFPNEDGRREEFVETAIKLKALEEKTGKTYPELLQDFQKVSSKISKLEKKRRRLREEERDKKAQILDRERTAEMRNRTAESENIALQARKDSLLKEISKDERVSNALNNEVFDIPCKQCGCLISIKLPTREEVNNLVRKNLSFHFPCRDCGNSDLYHPNEIMIQLGWALLPTDDFEEISI